MDCQLHPEPIRFHLFTNINSITGAPTTRDPITASTCGAIFNPIEARANLNNVSDAIEDINLLYAFAQD